MPKKSLPPVFKEYTMGQIVLLPMDLEAEIELKHLVRVVNAAIEKMDLRMVYEQYKGGGTRSTTKPPIAFARTLAARANGGCTSAPIAAHVP